MDKLIEKIQRIQKIVNDTLLSGYDKCENSGDELIYFICLQLAVEKTLELTFNEMNNEQKKQAKIIRNLLHENAKFTDVERK